MTTTCPICGDSVLIQPNWRGVRRLCDKCKQKRIEERQKKNEFEELRAALVRKEK